MRRERLDEVEDDEDEDVDLLRCLLCLLFLRLEGCLDVDEDDGDLLCLDRDLVRDLLCLDRNLDRDLLGDLLGLDLRDRDLSSTCRVGTVGTIGTTATCRAGTTAIC